MLNHLKKRFYPNKSQTGFTMIELLIVAAILAVLMVILLLVYQLQLGRARDARRKADLEKIKIAFEEFYNDNGCYPASSILNNCNGPELQPYLNTIPCDPITDEPYLYIPDGNNQCSGYRLLTNLEDDNDPSILKIGCGGPGACGFGDYNWGVSTGMPVAGSGVGGSGSGGTIYACDPQGVCNQYSDPGAAGCPLTFTESDCQNRCSNPSLRCDE